MKYLLSITFIFCVCYSCTRETMTKYKKINFQINNYQAFNVNVIKSIPLETKDESLVGSISKLDYVDQRIYILDFNNKSILCFSDSSKFLFRINSGRGPGELIDPIDFAIVNSSLLVVDQNMFKIFDLRGNLINKIQFMNGLYCWKFNFVQDSALLIYGNTPSINDLKKMESDNSIKIENIYSQYKLIDNALSKELKSFLPISFNLRTCMCQKPTTVYEDHILCLSPPTNYIYEYKNQHMKIKYEIDFNRKGFTKHDIKKGEKFLIKILRAGIKYGRLDFINETKNLISFSYMKTFGQNSFGIFSKISYKSADFKDILSQAGLPNAELLATSDENFLCVLYPSKITKAECNQLNQNLNLSIPVDENSNPLILEIQLSEKDDL